MNYTKQLNELVAKGGDCYPWHPMMVYEALEHMLATDAVDLAKHLEAGEHEIVGRLVANYVTLYAYRQAEETLVKTLGDIK